MLVAISTTRQSTTVIEVSALQAASTFPTLPQTSSKTLSKSVNAGKFQSLHFIARPSLFVAREIPMATSPGLVSREYNVRHTCDQQIPMRKGDVRRGEMREEASRMNLHIL